MDWGMPSVPTMCILTVPVPAILQNSDMKVIKMWKKYLKKSNEKVKIILPVDLQLSTPVSPEYSNWKLT
jgi:hypothetical protein